jgi:DNA repair exonuclease SbcCD ATPase subunit
MRETGIALEFTVSWSQETKKPAEFCDQCGAPFPASARVKQCGRCSAERGRKLSNELRVELSDKSGGADDLAGVMFQLAAAHWLRRYQGSEWAIFLVDEPFGALDVAHVRRLSAHLGRLLGEQFGAVQAFIVAHHAEVLEATPGRIHITSSESTSVIEVLGG